MFIILDVYNVIQMFSDGHLLLNFGISGSYRFEIINSTNQVVDYRGDIIPSHCKTKLVSYLFYNFIHSIYKFIPIVP